MQSYDVRNTLLCHTQPSADTISTARPCYGCLLSAVLAISYGSGALSFQCWIRACRPHICLIMVTAPIIPVFISLVSWSYSISDQDGPSSFFTCLLLDPSSQNSTSPSSLNVPFLTSIPRSFIKSSIVRLLSPKIFK